MTAAPVEHAEPTAALDDSSPQRGLTVRLLTSTVAWGGAEVHTVQLARALRDRGHQVEVLQLGHDTYGGNADLRDAGIPICTVPVPGRPSRTSLRTWLRLLEPHRADVLVLVKCLPDTVSARLDLAARLRSRRYVTVEHSRGPELPPRRRPVPPGARARFPFGQQRYTAWRYRYLLARHARSLFPHRVICVSEAIGDRLVRDFHFPPDRLAICLNGVDTTRFVPDPQRRDLARARWGVPRDACVVGMIGRLMPEKGLRDLLHDFADLVTCVADRDPWLVLVGSGREEDALRAQADALGIADRVRLPGPTAAPWEDCCGLDVFTLSSTTEGTPLALLEAMACGVPPVAFGVGSVPRVLDDPAAGWLVEPGDQVAFTHALLEAVSLTPEALAERGAAARARVEQHFELGAAMTALCEEIEGVARAGGVTQ